MSFEPWVYPKEIDSWDSSSLIKLGCRTSRSAGKDVAQQKRWFTNGSATQVRLSNGYGDRYPGEGSARVTVLVPKDKACVAGDSDGGEAGYLEYLVADGDLADCAVRYVDIDEDLVFQALIDYSYYEFCQIAEVAWWDEECGRWNDTGKSAERLTAFVAASLESDLLALKGLDLQFVDWISVLSARLEEVNAAAGRDRTAGL
ncbi:hypothetical protein [Mycobacteroides abscessus]|uniref:hypothetical protein n=1 Tax=Mycobacteroides abscessus TaxID=36809 RepID=UPI00092AC50E|nr:hypothetical protein [Mycobacteroides abscessus]SHQ48289.1 Uncharacterised protein [Mycobacteroides abscessus subsp. abscessus]SKQ85518.1 Uncharacterised protein [Mycobacteroides abscessus subsp. massiliense]SLC48968.1 Uncharacterised protein [Mycobacteroides abscessus subsp. massiliense]